ncbi:hypothetical protein JXC34_01860 [Candidatus Woesearchaeota archaeon]|nr:hypothetical protein [Candidatus Woesearchaeota archaeon]
MAGDFKERMEKITEKFVKEGTMSFKEALSIKKPEMIETSLGVYTNTNYPDPINRFFFVHETFQNSIEEMYFWIMNHLKDDLGLHEVDKITDIFSASEQSAFFGVSQHRLGIQQDKISQFMGTIGKMTKELFQLVRELRIIDERLDLYNKSKKGDNAAEISLKGYWIDLVEGGSKNPASTYGMASQVGFATLPDLFFAAPASLKSDDVDKYVDEKLAEFNRKVREVLKRKLKTFLVWKEQTHKELDTRRNFTIKYLRQHYVIIKTYMSWVKPYLRNVKRMTMDESKMISADLIGAFEGSVVEIEILTKKKIGKYYACILAHWFYRTRPAMSYQQEGYQRGPIHVGRAEMTLRNYVWTKEQVEAYKKLKEEEDLELIGSIDDSLKEAMDALGDDLKKYLEEGGEKFEKEETKEEPKRAGLLDPFVSLFKGFGDIGKAFVPEKKKEGPKKLTRSDILKNKDDFKKAEGTAKGQMYQCYKNYKKAHKFIHW